MTLSEREGSADRAYLGYVARNSAFITGIDETTKQGLVEFFYRPPLREFVP